VSISIGSTSNPSVDKYKVAAVQFEPTMFQKEQNIGKLLLMVEEAAKDDARLIATPEMGTTGYCWYSREEVKPYVEPVPGPTTDRFGEIARKYNCWIVVGMPEVDPQTDIYYNSAVLVGPEGVVGVHRKSHVYISEPKWSKQGDHDHQVYETPIGNIAMLICMDIHFVETARIQGLRNADVICHISNWLAEKTPAPYWINRAFDNGCYVLEANRWGLERAVQFSGGSCLINPDGTIQSYVDVGDLICYGEVDIARARAKALGVPGENKFKDRRPDQYMTIMSDTYLWNPLDFHTLYGYDPLPKGKRSTVAAVQMRPTAGNKSANLDRIAQLFAEAVSGGSELVVFPELAVTGVVDAPEKAQALAEPVPGPAIDALIDLAMAKKAHLVVGLVEKDGDALYNTAVLIGPEGLAGKYRQLHLDAVARKWAAPGNLGLPHFNIPVGRVGLMIGYDAMFVETGRCLALAGVDILCCPSAVSHPKPYGLAGTAAPHNYPIPTGASAIHWHLFRVRGGENNCYMIFANQYGPSLEREPWFGRSGIFGPDTFAFPRTETILPETGEAICTLQIDTGNLDSVYPTNVVRRKDIVMMRLPLWYDVIVAQNPPIMGITMVAPQPVVEAPKPKV